MTLALVPLLARAIARDDAWVAAVMGGVVVALYFSWTALFSGVIEVSHHALPLARLGVVIVGFSALFLVQAAMQLAPRGRLARALYPYLYAGLFLDELFTRVTFRIWPARLPPRSRVPIPTLETQEA